MNLNVNRVYRQFTNPIEFTKGRYASISTNNNNLTNNHQTSITNPQPITNLLNLQNDSLLEYYKNNYFLTIQPFFYNNFILPLFLDNIELRFKETFKNMLYHLRVLIISEIINKRNEFQTKVESEWNNQNKLKFYTYYLNLYNEKLNLVQSIYGINPDTIDVNRSLKIYNFFKNIIRDNSLKQRQLGLLKNGLCKSEFHMIDLIAQYKKRKNFTQNNYESALNNYAHYVHEKYPERTKTKNGRNISIYNILKKHKNIPGISNKFQENNFNLFSFSKKEHLLGTKCKYEFTERNLNNKQNFLDTIRSLPVMTMNWDEIINFFGIDQLEFIKTRNSNNVIKNTLSKLFSLLTIPINEEDSKLLRTSRDNILFGISLVLFNNNYNLKKPSGKIIAKGAYGTISKISNKEIIKGENLRSTIKNQSITKGSKTYYPLSSYMSSFTLLAFVLQKFLYNLNPEYIPNIYDLQFNFESNKPLLLNKRKLKNMNEEEKSKYLLNLKSMTRMNISGSQYFKLNNNLNISKDFYTLLFKDSFYNINNFIPFVLKILYKLCEILEFYQNQCMFIHRDLHAKNVMVNFRYKNGLFDIDNFNVQIIDFSFSSIVIKNNENKISFLTYENYKPTKDLLIANPYINNEWNQTDLKYFFIFLFLEFSNKFLLNPLENDYHITIIRNILSILNEIFNINTDYLLNFNNLNNSKLECSIRSKLFVIFLKKESHKNIFGENFNYDCYIPKILKNILKTYIE